MFCNICYETKNDLYTCKCGMHYCDRCIIDIIIHYEFKCTNCNKHIKLDKLMNLMTKESNILILIKEYCDNWDEFRESWLKTFNYDVLKCNKCHNKLSYKSPNYYCDKCDKPICFVCLNIHQKECCTKEEFSDYCSNIKHCPNCMYKIYKTKGCDNMFCTNCRTGFKWSTGKIIDKYFENPERSNTLSRDKTYVQMNDDVFETYKMENMEFVTKLYNQIVKNKNIIIYNLNNMVDYIDSFAIVRFMEEYIKYRLKLKTLKIMYRNLYLYESIKNTHLTLKDTVYNLVKEMINMKYKYIEEISCNAIISLPIIGKDDLNKLKEFGLYEYFIDCVIRLNNGGQTKDVIDEAGTMLIHKYIANKNSIVYY